MERTWRQKNVWTGFLNLRRPEALKQRLLALCNTSERIVITGLCLTSLCKQASRPRGSGSRCSREEFWSLLSAASRPREEGGAWTGPECPGRETCSSPRNYMIVISIYPNSKLNLRRVCNIISSWVDRERYSVTHSCLDVSNYCLTNWWR